MLAKRPPTGWAVPGVSREDGFCGCGLLFSGDLGLFCPCAQPISPEAGVY